MILFQSLHVQQQAALPLREALGAGLQWEGARALSHTRGIYLALTPRTGQSLDNIHTVKQHRLHRCLAAAGPTTSACLAQNHELRMRHPWVREVGSSAQG